MNDETLQWIETLDQLGAFPSLKRIQAHLKKAPEQARQTPDYWYAKGVVDVAVTPA